MESAVVQSPSQQPRKEAPLQPSDQKPAVLQSSLRELKDNYYEIEGSIIKETQKQRETQKERYSQVLDKVQTLKKLLKIEVEQRKTAEEHFRKDIQAQSNGILTRFTAEYLNQMREMQEQIDGFSQRRQQLDLKMQLLTKQIETRMVEQKSSILHRIAEKR